MSALPSFVQTTIVFLTEQIPSRNDAIPEELDENEPPNRIAPEAQAPNDQGPKSFLYQKIVNSTIIEFSTILISVLTLFPLYFFILKW